MSRRGPIPTQEFSGRNNADLEASRARLLRGQTYRDLSTVLIVANRGVICSRVVECWMNLASPMNPKFYRLFIPKKEVADAYNCGVELVLSNPQLSEWKYILTLEEDNCPPPDGLLKLYESMAQFDVVGGLYWVKGDFGQPMIYGDPKVMPKNFVPQLPRVDSLQECNGLGMGFTLFKLDMFRKIPKPWFKTLQEYTPGVGMRAATQDLYFFQEAAKSGFRFACDTRVRVGHWGQCRSNHVVMDIRYAISEGFDVEVVKDAGFKAPGMTRCFWCNGGLVYSTFFEHGTSVLRFPVHDFCFEEASAYVKQHNENSKTQ